MIDYDKLKEAHVLAKNLSEKYNLELSLDNEYWCSGDNIPCHTLWVFNEDECKDFLFEIGREEDLIEKLQKLGEIND